MQREYHRWHTGRLGRDMGVVVYGHWGTPVLAFPTSGGDEWEFERQGMIEALGALLDAGRIKLFCVGSNSDQSFYDRGAHPFHRSWMQRQWDEYVRQEVVPFVQGHCQGPHPLTTIGASLGAYHAANTLFKHADVVSRCIALSGLYDLRDFMGGLYDDNFYFNNPVDYLGGMNDPALIATLSQREIRIVTGHGPWEHPERSYALSRVLGIKGIRHHLDDWGPEGGHDWPYWRRQAVEYLK